MTTNNFRKYFNKCKPSGAICLVLFGILFFLLGISLNGGFMWAIIGAIMVGGGICMIIKFYNTHSDSSVDAFCNNQAKEYYLLKKRVVESYDEIIIDELYSGGYSFNNIFSARLARRGNDRVWRSSIIEMICLFFTAENVYYYSKRMSLITNEKSEEQKEFHYFDIQMVSLETFNQAIVVAIAIPGNEKIYINCKNKETATIVCDKMKEKMSQA